MNRKKTQQVNKEALLLELDLHKVEFEALRQEILQTLESERQYLYLSLVAFGVGLGITPIISSQKAYVILLLFPLVFHVLLWEMLNSIQSIRSVASYLMNVLIPRVNTILDMVGREDQNVRIWGWEEHHLHLNPFKFSRLIAKSFMPTRHWVPFFSAGAFLGVYLFMIQNNHYSPSNSELALVAVNLLLLIWAVIQRIFISLSSRHAITKERE